MVAVRWKEEISYGKYIAGRSLGGYLLIAVRGWRRTVGGRELARARFLAGWKLADYSNISKQTQHLVIGSVVLTPSASVTFAHIAGFKSLTGMKNPRYALFNTAAIRINPALPPGTMHTFSHVY